MPPAEPQPSWFGVEEGDVRHGCTLDSLTQEFVRSDYTAVLRGCAGLTWEGLPEKQKKLALSIAVQCLQEGGAAGQARELMEQAYGGVCGMPADMFVLYMQLLAAMREHKTAAELCRAHLSVNKANPSAHTLNVLSVFCLDILPVVESPAAAHRYLGDCYMCYLPLGSAPVDRLRAEVEARATATPVPRPPAERTVVEPPQPAAPVAEKGVEAQPVAVQPAAAQGAQSVPAQRQERDRPYTVPQQAQPTLVGGIMRLLDGQVGRAGLMVLLAALLFALLRRIAAPKQVIQL